MMGKKKPAAPSDPRSYSLSEGISEILRSMSSLSMSLTEFPDQSTAEEAVQDIERVKMLVAACSSAIGERGWQFESAGGVSEPFSLDGWNCASGHEAAFQNATNFLSRLYYELDKPGHDACRKDFLGNPTSENSLRCNCSTGFDPGVPEPEPLRSY